MRALALSAPEHFAFVDLPEPGRPGPGEALVRIHAVGVCGTDVSGYRGKMPFIQYPRILGHELGVQVLETGPDVHHLTSGMRCSVEPYLNCGHCPTCLQGHTNCCETLTVLGVHGDGGLRPRMILPAHKLHTAPDLTYEQLALVETLGIGCHAVHRGHPLQDQYALIIGTGPIGLSVLEFARLTGARLIVIEPNEQRREFVRRTYGIEAVHANLTPEDLAGLTEGRMAQVVFDATGNAESMARALEFAAFSGRVVYVGITTQPVPLNDPLFHRRELTLLASRNAVAADFGRIISLVRDGAIDTRPWITHRLAFNDVPRDFPSLLKPESQVVKAVIEMPED